MRLRVRIAILATCVSVAFASATFAQEPPQKIQAGGGFMYILDSSAAFRNPVTLEAGPSWFAKVTGHVTPHFGVVGEVSVSYFDAYGRRGVRHHEDYSSWTWRDAAGVMLPGR